MIIENIDDLKVWLLTHLNNICEADPTALAKYIVALVKKEKPENELRAFCVDQLEVFLLHETKQFVDMLFEALRTRSYIPAPKPFIASADSTTNHNAASICGSDPSSRTENSAKTMTADGSEANQEEKKTIINLTVTSSSASDDNQLENKRKIRTRSRSCSPNSKKNSSPSCSSPSSSKEKDGSDSSSAESFEFRIASNAQAHTLKPFNRRCRDYDEKGFCVMGDYCPFDHGADPLIVDDVSILKFQVPASQVSSSESSTAVRPPYPPPPYPPPPPPLPPSRLLQLNPGMYSHEPYNPESPGMNIDSQQGNSYVPLFQFPSSQLSSGSSTQIISSFPSYKPQRTRELIGVPILNDGYGNKESKTFREKKASFVKVISPVVESSIENENKRKPHDRPFNEPVVKMPKINSSRCTLEVRKIPKHLNSIEVLNGHFSRFGTVVNLQVNYDGDPEAALVQFQNDYEANRAYRSTEPVLDNRFIKLFYHKKEKSDETLNAENCSNLHQCHTVNPQSNPHSRTVFKPTVKKISPPTRSVSKDQNDAIAKRIELYKKKQELLVLQMQNLKLIMNKHSKAKSLEEKVMLKRLIMEIFEKIKPLQEEVRVESEELKVHLNNAQTNAISPGAVKELLDAELDLYSKEPKCTDVENGESLINRVNQLKEKVKALGLLDNSSKHFQNDLKKKSTLNGSVSTSFPANQVDSDKNERSILVSGLNNSIDIDSLKKHFSTLGRIENVDASVCSGGIVFTFSSKDDAEKVYSLGTQFGDKSLSLSFYNSSVSYIEPSAEKSATDDDPQFVVVDDDDDDDDEEEEEDSEARSWRR